MEEFSENLKGDPIRVAFLDHLKKVFKAMHDIEWVDSGDYSDGDEHEAITACLEAHSETKKNLVIKEIFLKGSRAGDGSAYELWVDGEKWAFPSGAVYGRSEGEILKGYLESLGHIVEKRLAIEELH